MKAVNYCNNFSKNNAAFGKKYLNTAVKIRRNDGLKDDGFFVEYERDNPRDISRIEDLKTYWKRDAVFMGDIADSFKTCDLDNIHIYGLEDEYGNTFALAKVLDIYDCNKGENIAIISRIQAAPDTMYSSSFRHHKGVGETLVSEIVKKAKNTGVGAIMVTSVNKGFWENSKLFQSKPNSPRIREKYLAQENFDDYIAFVENKKKPGFNTHI